MFRSDRPIVTIITPHAGSGCHHGALIQASNGAFELRQVPVRNAVFGRFYVIPAAVSRPSGHSPGAVAWASFWKVLRR